MEDSVFSKSMILLIIACVLFVSSLVVYSIYIIPERKEVNFKYEN